MGQRVVDGGGRPLGVVTDLRCVQDAPERGHLPWLRVQALVVSRRHTGALLGYDGRRAQGPWLVRTVVRTLHRHAVVVPWEAVADPGPPIRVRDA
jgi:hypothetical protein